MRWANWGAHAEYAYYIELLTVSERSIAYKNWVVIGGLGITNISSAGQSYQSACDDRNSPGRAMIRAGHVCEILEVGELSRNCALYTLRRGMRLRQRVLSEGIIGGLGTWTGRRRRGGRPEEGHRTRTKEGLEGDSSERESKVKEGEMRGRVGS